MSSLRVPIATYRLQFSGGFRFEDARRLVPYLSRLGISDLYASPIFRAGEGSPHGYDVADPSRLNPELGTEADFNMLSQRLQEHGLGLLLDIVPNHMAASAENPWWMDFLENGWCSPYAGFFDTGWDDADSAARRIVLPILGRPLEQALQNGELVLASDQDGLFVGYHGRRLPLEVGSYHPLLARHRESLEAALGAGHAALRQLKRLMEAMAKLPSATGAPPSRADEPYRQRQKIKQGLRQLVEASPEVKAFLEDNIAWFNGSKGRPESFGPLAGLLGQQVYRLAFWRTARRQASYRRFFDINELVGVRVEEPRVFAATHALVLRLVGEGRVTGLRIDHIDGLYDPLGYLLTLQRRISGGKGESGKTPACYVVVEKVLAADEALPAEWPVSGTTGYDFLNMASALLVDGEGAPAMDEVYRQLTGSRLTFADIVYHRKKQVIRELFPGELKALGRRLGRLAEAVLGVPRPSPRALTAVLAEVTACLPVYRTYIRALAVSPQDRFRLEQAVAEARRWVPEPQAAALDFLRRVLLLDFPDAFGQGQKEAWLRFVRRWQQITGAIMAKGFEDTAFYSYSRLLSLNEVGGDSGAAGLPVAEFHRRHQMRRAHWPHTLNVTSTHDTKRGEDVRARINVLSEIPQEWREYLRKWRRWNRPRKPRTSGRLVPEPDMELLLYQTLLGAWPLREEAIPEFKERLSAYMLKAAREAKRHTSWLSPSRDYEGSLLNFAESILDGAGENEFLRDFLDFQKRIAYYGALNSLAQVLLKVASPGVPDFYQGTELWDLSLVDPDNRRPVDFEKRAELLDAIVEEEAAGPGTLVKKLLASWPDGRVKLYLTYKALNVRRAHKDLFRDGGYTPLSVLGERQEHLVAFGRHKGDRWVLAAFPRLLTGLVRAGELPLGEPVWGDDRLLLPASAPEHWLNALTGEKIGLSGVRGLPVSHILSAFPVALLVSI